MDGKKSFIFYNDWISTFELLEDIEAGQLIKHILRYVNGTNPEPPDRTILLIFEPIKQHLKRDLKKWETKVEKCSKAGKTSAMLRKNNATKPTDVDKRQQMNTVNDSDNVNENVDDKKNILLAKYKTNTNPLLNNSESFILSIEEAWQPIVKKWLDYKKEKKQTYESELSLSTMYKQLKKFSHENPQNANEIIENSIANNYSGFFKQNESKSTKNVYKQYNEPVKKF
jgi:hypothetical protein